MINDLDITDIEGMFSEAVRNLGFERVWNNRPKSTSDTISDFVIVRVVGGISDESAYGSCRVLVTMFARDVREMKNGKKLSVMHKKMKSLPLDIDRLVVGKYPRVVGDTADDFGFHSRTLNFKVFIKTV